eukprot:IDg8997t1
MKRKTNINVLRNLRTKTITSRPNVFRTVISEADFSSYSEPYYISLCHAVASAAAVRKYVWRKAGCDVNLFECTSNKNRYALSPIALFIVERNALMDQLYIANARQVRPFGSFQRETLQAIGISANQGRSDNTLRAREQCKSQAKRYLMRNQRFVQSKTAMPSIAQQMQGSRTKQNRNATDGAVDAVPMTTIAWITGVKRPVL